MKLPGGYIFLLRSKNRGTTIEVEQKDLVLCKNCIWQGTEDCKWRSDETPDDDDFCSVGEEV